MADGYVLRLNADPVDGTPQYPALAERLFSLIGIAPGSSALRGQTGRRLGPGLELAVAGDSLTATVQPGVCVVPAPNATNGPYIAVVNAAKTITMPAKPGAGLQRRDRVVVRVYDEEVAEAPTTLREARVELVTGTAAASPSAPALPLMSYEIGQLNTTSTTTTVYSTNLVRTWSPGGIGVVQSQSERDALALYDGLVVYRDDIDELQARMGGAWKTFTKAAADPATPFIRLQHNTSTTRAPGVMSRIAWAATIDAEGGTSLSGSQITLPPGVYVVTYQITADWDQWPAELDLRKNSAGSATGGSSLGSALGSDNHAGSESVRLQRVLRVNSGDYLECFLGAHASATTSVVTTGASLQNFFDAVRVAA